MSRKKTTRGTTGGNPQPHRVVAAIPGRGKMYDAVVRAGNRQEAEDGDGWGYDDDSLPAAGRAGIGHMRNGFYVRLFCIVLDDEAAELQTEYMAEGVLLAAIVDPRAKVLHLLSHKDKERAKAALKRHVKDRQEKLRAAATGAHTNILACSEPPVSRETELARVKKKVSSQNFLQWIESRDSRTLGRNPLSSRSCAL